jgi:hypothetical protein
MLGDLLQAGKGPLPEVARALGALGESGPLFHVLTHEVGSPQAVQSAALTGIAYLPDGAQAFDALRYYGARLPSTELRRTAERALLTAYRLRADRSTAGR